MEPLRVLIVDDHAIVRAGLRALINQERDVEAVGEATDGADAVRKVGELQPDVVLMDLAMSGVGGLSATRTIAEKYPDVRILVLTMYDDEVHLKQLLRAGASGYLIKGAGEAELINAIHAVHSGGIYIHPSMAQAILEEFRPSRRTSHVANPSNPLTDREAEVLRLAAWGYTSVEIAQRLSISPRTVEAHRSSIAEKLGITTRAELMRYARECGYLDEPL